MKELITSIMLLFSSLTGSVDPRLGDEQIVVYTLKAEIKELQRKLEWINAMDGDIANKYLQMKKISDDISKKKEKLKSVEKLAKLKQKWAVEDSLEISKNYPLLKIDTLKLEEL